MCRFGTNALPLEVPVHPGRTLHRRKIICGHIKVSIYIHMTHVYLCVGLAQMRFLLNSRRTQAVCATAAKTYIGIKSPSMNTYVYIIAYESAHILSA